MTAQGHGTSTGRYVRPEQQTAIAEGPSLKWFSLQKSDQELKGTLLCMLRCRTEGADVYRLKRMTDLPLL